MACGTYPRTILLRETAQMHFELVFNHLYVLTEDFPRRTYIPRLTQNSMQMIPNLKV